MDITRIKAAVEAAFEEVVALRRDIHMHPELSEQEARTERVISEYLTSIGVQHETGVAGHGVIAIIGDPKAPCAVGIRGDIDALPIEECTGLSYASQNAGVMHACGHDLHTAILLGTAKILKQIESDLPGAVKLFFQPAEETIGGADAMIRHGALENPRVTRVISLHADPNYPVGTVYVSTGKMNASTTELNITVNGVACHGAHPEKGVDAIVVASQIVTALQSISSRATSPTTPVIVTIGTIHGGTKENVVAGTVKLGGTIRALDFKTRDFVKAQVKTIAEQTAKAFGATADVALHDGYPPLVNDRDTALSLAAIAQKELGESSVIFMEEPSLGADDFAYFSAAVPGVYFNVGTFAPDQFEPQMIHNEHFAPDEGCIKVGMLLEVLGALTFLDEDKARLQGA